MRSNYLLYRSVDTLLCHVFMGGARAREQGRSCSTQPVSVSHPLVAFKRPSLGEREGAEEAI